MRRVYPRPTTPPNSALQADGRVVATLPLASAAERQYRWADRAIGRITSMRRPDGIQGAVAQLAVVTFLFAGSGCGRGAHSASPAQQHETPDDVLKWCSTTPGVCRDLVPRLTDLSLPEHSVPSYNFAEMMREILAGRSAMVSPEFARAIRAVLSDWPVVARLKRVTEMERQRADYDKQNLEWRNSSEGQTYFASLALEHSLAIKEAYDEARRGFRQLAERMASVAATVPDADNLGPAAQHRVAADGAAPSR